MSWNYVRLGDVCSKIGSGATPKGGATVYIDSGISLIRSQNVYNLEFSYDGLAHITEDAAEKLNGVTVLKNDVLLNITGDSVARTCIVPESVLPARVNQHVAIVRPNQEEVNPLFLNYYLASPYMQSFMLGLAVGKGASRNAMTKDMIANFEVPCPPIDIQESIVSILSAYDNLIENNQKQIKLLEEAAQRVYKEWFIDLRFPGYEYTVIVDGVPEGWSYKPLSALFNFVRGKSYTSKELSDTSGVLMVNLKNIRAFGGYNRNAEKRFTGKYKDEQALYPGDLVMGVTDMTQERRLVGHTAIVPDLGEPMTFSMDLIKLVPLSIQKSYLYSSLYYGGYSFKISPLANGVNVLHLKPEAMMNLQMLVPTGELMDAYGKVFDPIQSRIELLQKQIDAAAESRDRLLPKLLNGEIEV